MKSRERKGRRNIIFLKRFFFRFRLSLLQVLIAKIGLLQRKWKRKVCLTHFLNLKFPGETVKTSGKEKVLRRKVLLRNQICPFLTRDRDPQIVA